METVSFQHLCMLLVNMEYSVQPLHQIMKLENTFERIFTMQNDFPWMFFNTDFGRLFARKSHNETHGHQIKLQAIAYISG